jgi:hypothetical protein
MAIKTAYGLDLAGYSTDGSAFAKAVQRDGDDQVGVMVIDQHCFATKRDGWQRLDGILQEEVSLIEKCLAEGSLDVDVPIDLQGLLARHDAVFVWELTKRPVDHAFGALPPLAQLIGSYVARFCNIRGHLHDDPLGNCLFETYPAASLKLMNLSYEKYKGEAEFAANEWIAVASNRPAEVERNGNLAEILNELGWTAAPQTHVGHDGFDAILCALTGVSSPTDRLEGRSLQNEICCRLQRAAGEIQVAPPCGYRLLKKRPKGVHIQTVLD